MPRDIFYVGKIKRIWFFLNICEINISSDSIKSRKSFEIVIKIKQRNIYNCPKEYVQQLKPKSER